jgi:hypothetical protein
VSIEKRLTKIETSLRPLEAVLLWLTEVLPLDINTFSEKLTKCPPHEDPAVRIPEMVAKAVRECFNEQTMTPAAARDAEFQARRQTAFLFKLVINLHIALLQRYSLGQWLIATVCLHGFQQDDAQCPPPRVGRLADLVELAEEINKNCLGDPSVLEALVLMLLLRETAAAISNQYFDGHRVLVAGAERSLNECIRELQSLVLAGKKSQPPLSAAGLAALESRIKLHVPQEVKALVVSTEAEVLECLGQWEAAWKLRQQHAAAVAERRISLCASRARIT